MDTKHFKSKIAPFFWVNHEDQFSVCLSTGEYKQELFETREEEGFEGNGYDWCALAKAFLKEYIKEKKLDESDLLKLGFYTRYGGKAVLVILIGFLIWGQIPSRKKEDKAEPTKL